MIVLRSEVSSRERFDEVGVNYKEHRNDEWTEITQAHDARLVSLHCRVFRACLEQRIAFNHNNELDRKAKCPNPAYYA